MSHSLARARVMAVQERLQRVFVVPPLRPFALTCSLTLVYVESLARLSLYKVRLTTRDNVCALDAIAQSSSVATIVSTDHHLFMCTYTDCTFVSLSLVTSD